jgi:hypothetical protein
MLFTIDTPIIGQESTATLDVSELLTFPEILTNPIFRSVEIWQNITLQFNVVSTNQKLVINFEYDDQENIQTTQVLLSDAIANDSLQLRLLTIYDKANGSFSISREEIIDEFGNFDIATLETLLLENSDNLLQENNNFILV